MVKDPNILKLVKEDALRIIGEKKSKKASLESIKSEIKVSHLFVSEAIRELKKEGLIRSRKDLLLLTGKGQDSAKNIIKKHLVLENYFKKTRGKEEAHQAAHILEHYISEEVLDNLKKLSTFKKETISLTKFEPHKESIIGDIIFSNYGLFERIVSMGIFLGEKIKITNEIPNGIIVIVGNKKFAIDHDIAKGIKVLR